MMKTHKTKIFMIMIVLALFALFVSNTGALDLTPCQKTGQAIDKFGNGYCVLEEPYDYFATVNNVCLLDKRGV